jgi:short subunit dehydrogenase-like uncharacterized protein
MPAPSPKPIAVYGAAGHTGRFVVAELRARGWQVIASGRDGAKLERVASGDAGVELRVAELSDTAALAAAFQGACAVINTAGPFLDSAAPVVAAALRVGIPYIDVTAEQGAALQLFADWDAPARAAGVPVIPAMGFYGGLGDLLATATMGDWRQADEISIAIALSYWRPTEGTRATGRRNTAPRLVLREGKLQQLQQPAPTSRWMFQKAFGEQDMVELPFTEAVLIARHLKTPNLGCFLSANALADIRNPDTPPPTPTDATGRSDQEFRIECRVTSGGRSRTAAVSGRDIYAITAPLVVAAVEQVAGLRKGGVFAPGELMDAPALLASLAPALRFEPAA